MTPPMHRKKKLISKFPATTKLTLVPKGQKYKNKGMSPSLVTKLYSVDHISGDMGVMT